MAGPVVLLRAGSFLANKSSSMKAMKYIGWILVLISAFDLQAQTVDKVKLSSDEFQAKLQQIPEGQVVDVRTPEEFQKNHIKGALNINFNSNDFTSQVATLDKSKPVMVYCLSGGRSARAADYMRKNGFKKVYELEGGMMQWTALNKPYESAAPPSPGMSLDQFDKNLKTDKLVLVDFYAKWCAPCKKMEPWLQELSKQYTGKITLLKIDADENSILVNNLKVDALPTLILYKNGKQVWSKTGLTEKAEIEKNIKAQH